MNRRDFILKTSASLLLATPAMKAAAFCRDFGIPEGGINALFVEAYKPDVVAFAVADPHWKCHVAAFRKIGVPFSSVLTNEAADT